MKRAIAILDSDFFLHYRPMDQIEWLSELNCEEAILMLVPTVVGQLNDKKDASGSHKLRSRAAAAIKRLNELFSRDRPVLIGNNVEFRFIAAEPLLDFASNDLTKDVKDDWLIATAISSKTTLTEDEFLVIVTGDLGLKMKGAPRGICTLTLPSKYRLPDEDDPAEKKIKDLENQLRQLSARLPILSLRFENDGNHLEVELTRPEPLEPLIVKRIAELRGEYPKLPVALGEQGLSVSEALDVLVPSQVAKYNSELEQFFNDYARFLSEAGPVLDRLKRCAKVALKLVNEGTAPAADVDIDIHIPDGVLVFGDDDRKPVPKAPKPPLRPTTIRESLESLKGFSASEYIASQLRPSFDFARIPTNLGTANVSGAKIRKTNSYDISMHVRNLKHDCEEDLDPFYIEFENWDSIRAFSIQYRLHAGNLPRPVTGELNLRFKVR
jgi:hypothetical protein